MLMVSLYYTEQKYVVQNIVEIILQTRNDAEQKMNADKAKVTYVTCMR